MMDAMRNLGILLSFLTAVGFADGPRKIFPYAYTQEDLPNGLRLITIPTDYPNIVALYIVVQTGSRNEVEPGKTGFAHLFEHMMFRGTEKFPHDKYEEVLKKVGAASNASTSADFTQYYTIFSKEDLGQILMMEADRFQNLKYPPAALKTESLAVLGEYNKNSSDPLRKLDEVTRDTMFRAHTYKHTTMGFLKDVQDMPNQYDYSLQFFERYYRPEYTTMIVAGDVRAKAVRALADKYWGGWKRGSYKAAVPAEPAQDGPRRNRIAWPSPTLPWVVIAYRGPAYTDTEKDSAALDALSFLAFSQNSELYQKLVIQEQKVDQMSADNEDHVDPYCFEIDARVKEPADMEYVEQQILGTVKTYRDKPVEKERLEAVKNHLRYSFSLSLDNSQSIAGAVARAVALRRTPETLNRIFALYAQLTPEDIQQAARKYLVESGRTTITMTGAAGGAK
jgi:zinc protease